MTSPHSQGLLLVYPAYLLSHSGDFVSGNHFNPFDRKLFAKDETVAAAVSSVAVIAWLGWLLSTFSLPTLLDAYLVPYFIFSAWLSLVTFLHHSDPKGVYYRDGEWTYLKVTIPLLCSFWLWPDAASVCLSLYVFATGTGTAAAHNTPKYTPQQLCLTHAQLMAGTWRRARCRPSTAPTGESSTTCTTTSARTWCTTFSSPPSRTITCVRPPPPSSRCSVRQIRLPPPPRFD